MHAMSATGVHHLKRETEESERERERERAGNPVLEEMFISPTNARPPLSPLFPSHLPFGDHLILNALLERG
jgi:hypothetical protein